MRRAAKTDTTHAEIRDALRQAGVSVYSLAAVGRGLPDFLCGYRGWFCCVEAKTGQREVNEAQRKFINECQGPVIVANGGQDAKAKFFERWSASILQRL